MQDSYNHYNAFRNITSQTCTYLRIWQDQMTRIMQLFRCDLQPQIAKHPIITHGQSYLKQLEATTAMRQRKKDKPTQPQPPYTGDTFLRRLQALYTEKHKVSYSNFLPMQAPCKIHITITMHFATSRRKPAHVYAYGKTK